MNRPLPRLSVAALTLTMSVLAAACAPAQTNALAVDSHGALVVSTGLGDVTFTAPVAYQERDGVRHTVAVAYRPRGHDYGFTVGPYDRALPLVIDPLLQATYLGGSGNDYADGGLAIHPTTGDIYVAGVTDSNNFPGTTGGPLPSRDGLSDAFVARLRSDLTALTQATYLGGGDDDNASALVIHPTTGDVYVAGQTALSTSRAPAGVRSPGLAPFSFP